MRVKSWLACVFLLIICGACEPNSGPPAEKHPWVSVFPGPPCAGNEAPWTCVRLMQSSDSASLPDADAGNNGGVDGGCTIQPVVVCCPLNNNNSPYAQFLAHTAYEDAPAVSTLYVQLNILCHPGADDGVTKTPKRNGPGPRITVEDYPVCGPFLPAGTGAGGGPAVSCGNYLDLCIQDSDCCTEFCLMGVCGVLPGADPDAGGAGGGGP
jgi:hypothetical protein